MKLLVKPLRKAVSNLYGRNFDWGDLDLPEVPDRIEFIRCLLGFPTIKDLANKFGIRETGISGIIKGTKTGWLLKTVDCAAEILGVDKTWILEGIGRPYRKDYSQYLYSDMSKDNKDYGIGDRIKEVREDEGMTIAVFSAKARIPWRKLFNIENGIVKADVDTVNKIDTTFGIHDAWMLRGEGKKKIKGA